MLSSRGLSGKVDTVLEIDTPEHLAFRVRVAGIARRSLAWTLDLLVRAAILFALYLGFIVASTRLLEIDINLEGVGRGLFFVALFVLDWLYFVAAEMLSNGRSPGKAALGLRVVRENGLPISWRESVLRNLLRAADFAIIPPQFLPVGPVVMAFDRKFRRLGDFVAGTMVVVEEKVEVAQHIAIEPDPKLVESLPKSLPLDHDDLEALELFVRREQMSEARREELAEIVAPEYARRLSMPVPMDATRFLAALWKRAQDPGRSVRR